MNAVKNISLTLCLTTSLIASSLVQAKDFRLGLITPPTHPWTLTANEFAKDVAEKSAGAHKISIFPAQQLGNEAQMMQQLQTGALDMAFLTLAEISNRAAEFGAFYAPFLVDDIDQAAKLLETEEAHELLAILPAKAGVVGLAYGMAGMRQILSRDAGQGAEALKGKKIRITPFEPIRDFYTAMGSAPTPLPLPAVYDALANGQVDAIDMDTDSIYVLKFHERANNLMMSNHMIFPMIALVSGRVWGQLSDEDKALIQTTVDKHLMDNRKEYVELDKSRLEALSQLDLNISHVDRSVFAEAVTAWETIWEDKSKGALTKIQQAAQRVKTAE